MYYHVQRVYFVECSDKLRNGQTSLYTLIFKDIIHRMKNLLTGSVLLSSKFHLECDSITKRSSQSTR